MTMVDRLREAQEAVRMTRRACDAAAVEETRLALSVEAAPEEARPALRAELLSASARLYGAGMACEAAQRALFAVLAESPAEELEIGDPLAGFVTVIDPYTGEIRSQREAS